MASYRLPRNEDIFFKKSYCPKCNKPIKYLSLVPILSWVFQGGKCSKCGAKISIRYPLIEIITSGLFVLSYLKFGVNYNTILFDLLITVSMIMLISDLETLIIPDSMQVCLLILSFIFIYINKLNFIYSAMSALLYFVVIYIAGFIVEKWKKKSAIGGGDIKFITIAGLTLGLENLPLFLFISGVIGIIFGLIWKKITKNEYFPFGPSLIIAYLVLFYTLSNIFISINW